jgi:hypothetical protein
MNNRILFKSVRTICETNGWGVNNTYNDKRKDGSSRVKIMRNGWSVPTDMKVNILHDVTEYFKANNIKSTPYFAKGERYGYGPYDYLAFVMEA